MPKLEPSEAPPRGKSSMRVFISYTHSDEDHARAIVARLREEGVAVWDPESEVLPGDNWRVKMGQALEKSDAVIILISPDSVRSAAVRRDIEYALGRARFR